MNETMKMKDIMELIEYLSRSQGFYGRMLLSIYELEDTDHEAYEELVEDWESRNFKDPLDFVLYVEC